MFATMGDHAHMKRLAGVLTVHAVLLAACTFLPESGPSGGSSSDPIAPATDQPSAETAPGLEEPPGSLPVSASPTTSTGPASMSAKPVRPDGPGVLTGSLGFGAVEGGCGFLETAEGKRYEVIYPAGWRLDRTSGHLLGPDGQDVSPGTVVSVRGSIATDIASICQVGPMFIAIEVISVGD